MGTYSGLDMTTFAAGLKAFYTPDKVRNMTYQNNPFWALIKKEENTSGKTYEQPVIYGSPQSRSAKFSVAQGQSVAASSQLKVFSVTRVSDYGIVTVDNQTIMASRNDAGAFMKARTVELNGAMIAVTDSLATALYRNGAGTLGSVGTMGTTTTTSLVVNLSSADDSVNFEPGMTLIASQYDTTSARAQPATAVITAVDRSAGTVTASCTTSSAIDWVANDVLCAYGDRTSTDRSKVSGLEAWVPATAPGATTFFGVARNADTRLGGLRFDATSYGIDEGLIKAAIIGAREGATIDHCFISYAKFADLVNTLGSKAQFVDLKTGGIGFNALRMYTPAGEIKIVPDRKCPTNRAFLTQLNTWKFISLGPVPMLLDYDGAGTIVQYNADGIEMRVGYYGNLVCEAPGHNVNVLV
jgi:hypothetical protein